MPESYHLQAPLVNCLFDVYRMATIKSIINSKIEKLFFMINVLSDNH